MATYDFSKLLQDAKAGGAWPVGDYDFEVSDTVVKQSQSSSSEMIVTKLRCLVGPYAGKTISNNFVLSTENPTALAIFFRHMTAFGLDDSFWASIGNGNLEPAAQALKGRRARITLGHRQWNGAAQNDIKGIKSLTEGMANTIAGMPATPPSPNGASVGTAPPPPPAQVASPPVAATQPSTAPPPAPGYGPGAPDYQPGYRPPEVAVAAPAAAPPPPPPPAPVAPAPAPAPVAAPVAAPGIPAGYTEELWASIPEPAKAAILANQASTPMPEAAPAPSSAPPPPPPLPV